MTPAELDEPLHGVSVYNPNLLSRDELEQAFVARMPLLDRVLADLRRERPGRIGQHRLFLGHCGMGKTSLLRRIAIAVEDDAELDALWLPLTFPEEQYNIADSADLWLNCLDAMSDALERRGRAGEAAALYERIQSLFGAPPESVLNAFLDQARRLERRLILLLDNVDLILERLRDDHWALRETLQSCPELLLIGASSSAIEASYQYDAAFYDFFRIDELKALTEAELRATLIRLADRMGTSVVADILERDPARIRALHRLAGGSPRAAVVLHAVLARGSGGDVGSDLALLLDAFTPFYKARFEGLPQRGQQLMDALAQHWNPASARQLADRLGWEVNLVSAQLDRLQTQGMVEKTAPYSGKRALFQVADRVFNLWYLMRASRRTRRRLLWLARFIYIWLSVDELDAPSSEPEPLASPVDGEGDLPRLRRLLEEWETEPTASTWAALLPVLESAARTGQAKAVRDLLDETGAGERWRPLREALAAIAEGSADYLRLVAPEVRVPASAIFDRLTSARSRD